MGSNRKSAQTSEHSIVLELEAKNAAMGGGDSLSFWEPIARTATYPTQQFLTSPAVTVTQLYIFSSCHTMTVCFMNHDSASFSWFCAYTLGLIRVKCVLPTMYLNNKP